MQARFRVAGGNARAAALSPERRSEIAKWARRNRSQRETRQSTDAELVKAMVHKLHGVDPDLAAAYKRINQMSMRFQERMLTALNPEDQEKVRIAWESVCPAQR